MSVSTRRAVTLSAAAVLGGFGALGAALAGEWARPRGAGVSGATGAASSGALRPAAQRGAGGAQEASVSPAPTSWRIAWQVPVADPWQGPIVVGRRGPVLLIERNAFLAVDAATGKVAWRHDLEIAPAIGCACLAAPAVAPERQQVYAVSAGNELRAVELDRGRIRWRRPAGDQVVMSPALAGDRVLVVTADGEDLSLMAFDAATGAPRWRSTESRRLLPDPIWDPTTGAIFLLDVLGTLRTLDATTGRLRWEAGASAPGDGAQAGLTAAHLVDGGLAVVRERGLDLVEHTSGALRWRYEPAGGWLAWAAGAGASGERASGSVLTGGLAGAIVALDVRTGAPRWEVPAEGGALIEPAVGAGVAALVMGDEVMVVGLDDGLERWRRPAGLVAALATGRAPRANKHGTGVARATLHAPAAPPLVVATTRRRSWPERRPVSGAEPGPDGGSAPLARPPSAPSRAGACRSQRSRAPSPPRQQSRPSSASSCLAPPRLRALPRAVPFPVSAAALSGGSGFVRRHIVILL